MTLIQVLLTLLIVLFAMMSGVAFRSQLGVRLFAFFLWSTAIAFVLFPYLTTRIAQRLGVGRGADLLFYLALFGGFHAFLVLYMRTRRLQRKLTAVVRVMAIRDAQGPTPAAHRP